MTLILMFNLGAVWVNVACLEVGQGAELEEPTAVTQLWPDGGQGVKVPQSDRRLTYICNVMSRAEWETQLKLDSNAVTSAAKKTLQDTYIHIHILYTHTQDRGHYRMCTAGVLVSAAFH